MAKLWIPIDHKCADVTVSGSTTALYEGYSFIRYTNLTCTLNTKLEISSGTVIRIGAAGMHGRKLTLIIHRRSNEDSGECILLAFEYEMTIDINTLPIFIPCLTHAANGWSAELLSVNGTL